MHKLCTALQTQQHSDNPLFELTDYFPSPPAVCATIITAAQLAPGQRVLEPSAGGGHLAAAALAACPGIMLDCVEIEPRLRPMLIEHGYRLVAKNFLDYQPTQAYDRIIANFPFSGGQDTLHARHAYRLLRPDGRLAAVLHRTSVRGLDRLARAFRTWLNELDATVIDLPPGSFLHAERPTNASIVLVTLDRVHQAAG